MNAVTREQIMTALFDLIANSSDYNTKVRGFKFWDEVTKEDRPAIFMVEGKERYAEGSGGHPPLRKMQVDFFIYVTTTEPGDGGPASILNPYLDALDKALQPQNALQTYKQTLGGLVNNCYIDGEILKIPGYVDGDGIAVVPVTIIAP